VLYNVWTVIIFAYLVGSFLNVIIYRLPIMLQFKNPSEVKIFNLALPRSHCVKCQKQLAWWHNIPVLSYGFLSGKCYYCHAKISWRYLVVEIAYIAMALLCYFCSNGFIEFTAYILFTSLILVIAAIDLETMLIPDILNYLLMWSGMLINSKELICSLKESVFGCVFGYLILWGAYKLILYTTKKHGFGYGDFKLLAALGAWLGVFKLFNVLFLASIIGLLYALITCKKMHEPLPFGPALCSSGFLILLFPHQFNLLHWGYLLFGT